MPVSLLNLFKYLLVVLVWLFFLRVLRAIWVESRPERSPIMVSAPAPAPTVAQPKASRRAKASVFSSGSAPKLRAVAGTSLESGAEFNITSTITIGRGQGCNIAIPRDTFASSVHARVYEHSNGYYVEDLDSTNGTFVNGKKISGPQVIVSGDRLQIGQTIFEVSV
ncbi:MAG: FHA domain-containing protein [Actinomycetota bacterium]|nr:MAG: FHA domain-containing protein [Actinomycetota bacterium]